jgi:predicted SnoaL-like aldol condensation-catalyzing enzyme
MNTKNKCIVSNFIEEIWNKHQFDKVDNYIHPDFQDHSLPPNFPASKKGLLLWIVETSKAFETPDTIEEIVCEGIK